MKNIKVGIGIDEYVNTIGAVNNYISDYEQNYRDIKQKLFGLVTANPKDIYGSSEDSDIYSYESLLTTFNDLMSDLYETVSTISKYQCVADDYNYNDDEDSVKEQFRQEIEEEERERKESEKKVKNMRILGLNTMVTTDLDVYERLKEYHPEEFKQLIEDKAQIGKNLYAILKKECEDAMKKILAEMMNRKNDEE